jgi:hypothetical protein
MPRAQIVHENFFLEETTQILTSGMAYTAIFFNEMFQEFSIVRQSKKRQLNSALSIFKNTKFISSFIYIELFNALTLGYFVTRPKISTV